MACHVPEPRPYLETMLVYRQLNIYEYISMIGFNIF